MIAKRPIIVSFGVGIVSIVIASAVGIHTQQSAVLSANIISPLASTSPLPSPTPTPSPSPSPKATAAAATQKPTPVPTPTPSPSPIPVTAEQLDNWFTKYSNEHSVDRSLLVKIAVCESGLQPRAVNGIYSGMFQFAPQTWITLRRTLNLDTNPALRLNAEEAIKTAAYKLALGGVGAWPNCSR